MERTVMAICQTCAMEYDPKVTNSPRRYCSEECYQFGERPYRQARNAINPDICPSCKRNCPCERAFQTEKVYNGGKRHVCLWACGRRSPSKLVP